MSSEEEHRGLLEALLLMKGPVVLSGYASSLYDEYLSDWEQVRIATNTQVGGKREEVLWINRISPPALFEGTEWVGA